MIALQCDGCGKQYRIDERAAGKSVRCKVCAKVIAVPANAGTRASLPQEDPLEAMAAMESSAAPPAGYRSPPPLPPAAYPSAPDLAYPDPYPAYGAPRRQPRRILGRNPNPAGTVGTDSLTPWLVLAFLVVQLGAPTYATIRGTNPFGPGAIWVQAVLNLILFFVLIGPSIHLGVWIMSKIFRCPVVDLPYFRGCGVAALPTLMLIAAVVLMRWNFVLGILVILSIVPVMFFALRFVFDLDWAGGVVAFAFSGVLFALAEVLTLSILAAVLAANLFHNPGTPSLDVANGTAVAPGWIGGGGGATPPTPSSAITAAPVDMNAQRLSNLATRVLDAVNQPGDMSRERLFATYGALSAELEQLRASKGTDPAFLQVADSLKALKAKADAAPSEQPGPEIKVAAVAAETWKAGAWDAELAPEVSYRGYDLRPPRSAIFDFSIGEDDPRGVIWRLPRSSATLTVSTRPNSLATQRQAWVVTRAFQRSYAQSSPIMWLDATDGGTVGVGRINELVFTRVVSSGQMGRRSIDYAALDSDHWLVMRIEGDASDSQSTDLLEAAARTIRRAAPGEAKKPLVSPEALVARLADDPDHAIPLLRKAGPAAEDALLAGLATGERRAQVQCAALLRDLGTAKSIPALQQAIHSGDHELVDAARAALWRLDPEHYNDVLDALDDLNDQNPFKHRDALRRLAATTPNNANRAVVIARAKEALLGRNSFFDAEPAGQVLIAWADDPAKIVPDLIPPLLEQYDDFNRRHTIMKILGKLKDKRGVVPVVKWLVADPDPAIAALIEMGPIAETEVAVHLREPNAMARLNAARVLEAIGTPKSYEALYRAAHDSRDAAAREAAQAALDSIKSRAAANRPTTGPSAH